MKDIYKNELILLRFFDEESHVEKFRSGQIRMMSTKHYKDLEKYSTKLYDNRYDSIENSVYVYNSDPDGAIKFIEPIKIGGHNYTKARIYHNSINSLLRISDDHLDERTKILCLYSLFKQNIIDDKLSSCISTLVKDFGNYYCLIINKREFISRIINGIIKYNTQKIAWNVRYGLVTYVKENKHNGRYGTFSKPSGLFWQNEYRIALETLSVDPFYLPTDNLKDITIWGKISDLLNGKINENGNLIISNYNK